MNSSAGRPRLNTSLLPDSMKPSLQPSYALEPPAKENDEKNGKRDCRSEMKEAEKVTQGRKSRKCTIIP